MKEVSKILIAYDGSSCSEAAIDDLARAGLPMTAEAVVISAADIILPPDEKLPADEMTAIRIPEVERRAKARAEKAFKEATALAERAAKRVKADFPDWNVETEVRFDAPAWAIIKLADSLGSDLIVVGSHGHSLVGGRLILGSVSQRVLYEAPCSVRVARGLDVQRNGPVRIVIGFNGSPDSQLAVAAVASRHWPEGSEALVLTAHDTLGKSMHDFATETLRAASLLTSERSVAGDPAHVLLHEATAWRADSIFVGTRDLHGIQHLLHGSVSSAVAARAHCSVEVTRAPRSVV
jgi:nucleotide-binding universal stress UspA family protein